MMENNHEFDKPNLENLSSKQICFIGLGTAASNCINRMSHSEKHSKFAYISLDLSQETGQEMVCENLWNVSLTQRQVETSLKCDLSDLSDSDDSALAANIISQLSELMEGFDSVFVFANLGRQSGSLLSMLLGQIAETVSTSFYGIKSLPLKMEGSARKNKADAVIAKTRAAYHQLILIPSQVCFEALDPRPKLPADFYSLIDERYAALHGMVKELINGPNILPIRLSDFQSILSLGGKGDPLFFSSIGIGKSAVSKILSELKGNLQIESWAGCHQPSDILLFCNASGGLSCETIDILVESVDRIFPHSQTLVGGADKSTNDDDEPKLEVLLFALQREERTADDIDYLTIASKDTATGVPKYHSQRVENIHEDELSSEFIDPFDGNSELSLEAIDTLKTQESGANEKPRADFSKAQENAYIAPAPDMSAELKQEILKQKKRAGKRKEAKQIEALQEQLPLAIISRGRFEGSEESLYSGQDLDIPTFIRKGIDIR